MDSNQLQIIIFLAGIQDFLGPMWLEERMIKIISFCDISLKTIFYQTFSFKYWNVLMLAKLLLLKQSVGGKGIFKMNQYSRREATCDYCGKVQVGWTLLEWLWLGLRPSKMWLAKSNVAGIQIPRIPWLSNPGCPRVILCVHLQRSSSLHKFIQIKSKIQQ